MVIPGAGDGEVGPAIEENLVSWWVSLRGSPGVTVDEKREFTRVIGGVAHPLCNHVFKARFTARDVRSGIAETLAPARERGLPMLWWVSPSSTPGDLADRLMEEGLVPAEEVSCMAADLASMNVHAGVPESVEILRVTGEETLRAWIEPFAEAFELPRTVGEFFFDCMLADGLGDEAPTRHYLGLLEGEPVACSTVAFFSGVAGFYNGATVERARRRGIGTAINSVAIRDALLVGYRVGVVQAMPMGVKICLPLGFTERYRMQAYLLDAV